MTGPGHLLHLPHHDGSERYVSQAYPRLGDTVELLVRIPHAADVRSVHLRSTPDAEPKFTTARLTRTTDADSWWSVSLLIHNPVMNYRFLLQGGPLGYQWLNGTGLHDRDVPDVSDFRITTFDPAPGWSTDAVVYQIFPDRFARSAAAETRPVPEWAIPATWDTPVAGRGKSTGQQFYGGDLDGIVEHLDHVQKLGVSVVYLTPVFPARSNHRYDAASFDEVDPVLGGDAALDRLSDAVHARGLKLIGDFTTNHTGVGHEWFRKAQADPTSQERGYYFFDGDDYASWLGVPSLPKLNYDSKELQQRIFDDPKGVVRRWISGDHALDGWRVDVANMTGRHGAQDHNAGIARRMRAAMAQVNPDSLLIGEHCHDFSRDAMGDGWHGVMNYAGFTRPLWTWLRHPGQAPDFLGLPVIVPRLGGRAVMETMREFGSLVPWTSLTHCFTLVGSHDTTRVRSLVGDDAGQVDVAAGLLLTMPGIPMVTYGDEIGMLGDFGEDGRRPMPWSDSGSWDQRIHEVYRTLIALRRSSPALHSGGLRWVYADDDVLVYLREHRDQVALVHLARLGHAPVELPAGSLPGIESGTAAYGNGPTFEGDRVVLTAHGPHVGVWTWTTDQ